jgi:ABC-2 type transport system permease protein
MKGRAVLAQARLETRLLLRSSESLLVTLGIPLGVLVFFSVVPVLPTGDTDAVTFLVPGVLALSASRDRPGGERDPDGLRAQVGRAQAARRDAARPARLRRGEARVRPRDPRRADRARPGLALGALGWRPQGGVLGVLLAVAAMLLTGLVMTSLGLALAGTLTAELTTAVTNALFLVLLLLGGVAVPQDVLPDALAAVGGDTARRGRRLAAGAARRRRRRRDRARRARGHGVRSGPLVDADVPLGAVTAF